MFHRLERALFRASVAFAGVALVAGPLVAQESESSSSRGTRGIIRLVIFIIVLVIGIGGWTAKKFGSKREAPPNAQYRGPMPGPYGQQGYQQNWPADFQQPQGGQGHQQPMQGAAPYRPPAAPQAQRPLQRKPIARPPAGNPPRKPGGPTV